MFDLFPGRQNSSEGKIEEIVKAHRKRNPEENCSFSATNSTSFLPTSRERQQVEQFTLLSEGWAITTSLKSQCPPLEKRPLFPRSRQKEKEGKREEGQSVSSLEKRGERD